MHVLRAHTIIYVRIEVVNVHGERTRDETRRGLMTRKLNLVAKVKRLFVVP